jgi:uncharacterized protein YhaN
MKGKSVTTRCKILIRSAIVAAVLATVWGTTWVYTQQPPRGLIQKPTSESSSDQIAREERLKQREAELDAREARLMKEAEEARQKAKQARTEADEAKAAAAKTKDDLAAASATLQAETAAATAERDEAIAEKALVEAKMQKIQAPSRNESQIKVRWRDWTTIEILLSVGILIFALIIFLLQVRLMTMLKLDWTPTAILRFNGLTLIIAGGLLLVVAGYSDQQIAPVIGLLGTIAGYLLGAGEKPAKKSVEE